MMTQSLRGNDKNGTKLTFYEIILGRLFIRMKKRVKKGIYVQTHEGDLRSTIKGLLLEIHSKLQQIIQVRDDKTRVLRHFSTSAGLVFYKETVEISF